MTNPHLSLSSKTKEGEMEQTCDHAESLYGRCTACGMTWGQQAAEQTTPTTAELAALLTDPAVLRGDHLSEEERREHERCAKSIVDAAVWSHPRYRA